VEAIVTPAGNAVAGPCVLPVPPADALAGIHHAHPGNAEAGNRLRGEAGTAEHFQFFFRSQAIEQILDAFFERRFWVCVNVCVLSGDVLEQQPRRDKKEYISHIN
jgi:hypothetical protein